MWIDLFPQLFKAVKDAIAISHPTAVVRDEYTAQVTAFPYVTMLELTTPETGHTLNYQEPQFHIGYQIDVYTDGGNKKSTAKAIFAVVDSVLADTWKMKRTASRPLQNAADPRIYRYMGIFEGEYLSTLDTIIS